ncbi:MAG: element excision factor XisH family protein [Chitinophagales bacterium]
MARDKYHDVVREALIKDGWDITDDPYRIETGQRTVEVDLGAERLIAAEKEEEKIAVEVKSFINVYQLGDFYTALGQFLYYRMAIEKTEDDRILFLAIPTTAYRTFFSETLTQAVLAQHNVRILVYHTKKWEIVKWIK